MSRRDALSGSRRWLSAATSLAGFIGVLLMPKCPLCVAVALSGLGVGAAWATGLSPYARPVAWTVAVAALALTVLAERRRASRRRESRRSAVGACCCSG